MHEPARLNPGLPGLSDRTGVPPFAPVPEGPPWVINIEPLDLDMNLGPEAGGDPGDELFGDATGDEEAHDETQDVAHGRVQDRRPQAVDHHIRGDHDTAFGPPCGGFPDQDPQVGIQGDNDTLGPHGGGPLKEVTHSTHSRGGGRYVFGDLCGCSATDTDTGGRGDKNLACFQFRRFSYLDWW